jgi:hypothetical protein
MSWSHFARSWPQRFSLILASFLQKPGLPFSDVLSEEEIQAAFDAQGASFAQGDDAVYTPAVTLWAFLSQVFFKDEQRSCQAAVARVATLMGARGKKISQNTGAYCRARAKLCEAVIRHLARQVAQGCEQVGSDPWLRCIWRTWHASKWGIGRTGWSRGPSSGGPSRTIC